MGKDDCGAAVPRFWFQEFKGSLRHGVSNQVSDPITPQRPALRIETRGFESSFNGCIAGMNLRTDTADSPLFGIFEECDNKAAANAFAAPLRNNKQGDDVHRFPAELGAPFIGRVSVAAQCSLGGFGNNDETAIGRVHDVLKYPASVLRCSLSTNVRQKLAGQFTQLVQVLYNC